MGRKAPLVIAIVVTERGFTFIYNFVIIIVLHSMIRMGG